MKDKTKVFSLFLLVMIFDSIFINYDLGLFNITLMRIVLFLMVVIIMMSILKKGLFHVDRRIKIILIFFYLWFIQMTLSLFWVTDEESVFKALYYYCLYILIIFVVVYLVQRSKLINIFKAMQMIAFLMGILGLLEYLGYIRFDVSRYLQEEYQNLLIILDLTKVTGTFVNENDYSLFLAMLFPFLLISVFKANKIKRILSLICIAIYLLIIYKNDAQLVLLMIGIEMIAFFILIDWKNYKKIIKNIFVVISILISFIFLILVLTDPKVASGTTSVTVRLNLAKNTWYALQETNFIGGGVSHFKYYMDSELYFKGITDPHNWWVELLVEHGIVIALFYISIYIYIIFLLLNLFKKYKDNIENIILLPMIISMVGLFVGALAPSGFYYYWPNWLYIGLAIGIINKLKTDTYTDE